jgi:hypothetical protein
MAYPGGDRPEASAGARRGIDRSALCRRSAAVGLLEAEWEPLCTRRDARARGCGPQRSLRHPARIAWAAQHSR